MKWKTLALRLALIFRKAPLSKKKSRPALQGFELERLILNHPDLIWSQTLTVLVKSLSSMKSRKWQEKFCANS
ncbi:unnamed protein product [Calypogeia fissa]